MKEARPRIGITTSARRGDGYYLPYQRAVEAVGADAVELPAGTGSLPELDGLLLPGGWDVDPSLYGEEPDPKVGPVDRQLDDTELRLFAQARGQDGTVEGVETSDGLIVAVQCHPEELSSDLPWARKLFERFVDRARRAQTLRS